MFQEASDFNQDISGWDVSSGIDFVSEWSELLLDFHDLMQMILCVF
jgi:surface protein